MNAHRKYTLSPTHNLLHSSLLKIPWNSPAERVRSSEYSVESETKDWEDGIDCLPSWETRCLTMPRLTSLPRLPYATSTTHVHVCTLSGLLFHSLWSYCIRPYPHVGSILSTTLENILLFIMLTTHYDWFYVPSAAIEKKLAPFIYNTET